jgi:hypothetical protein
VAGIPRSGLPLLSTKRRLALLMGSLGRNVAVAGIPTKTSDFRSL